MPRAEKYTKWFCGYKNSNVRTTAAITAIPILERFLRCFSSASDRSRFGSLIVPTAKITTAETATQPMQTQGYELINDATGIDLVQVDPVHSLFGIVATAQAITTFATALSITLPAAPNSSKNGVICNIKTLNN